jgi:hypothetical protein
MARPAGGFAQSAPMHRLAAPLLIALAACVAAPAVASAAAPDEELPDELVSLLEARRYDEALPQLRALSAAHHRFASYVLGQMHVCARGVAFSCAQAQGYIAKSFAPGETGLAGPRWVDSAKNEMAWIHAACQQEGFGRDPELALSLAEDVNRHTHDPYFQDTLAAAWANAGDFRRAARVEGHAIAALAGMLEQDPANGEAMAVFNRHLASYRRAEPVRFGAADADAECNGLP